MPAIKHNIAIGQVKEISSSTGSMLVVYGEVQVTVSDKMPTKETFVPTAFMPYRSNHPFRVKSGEKLYAMCTVNERATITYTEA